MLVEIKTFIQFIVTIKLLTLSLNIKRDRDHSTSVSAAYTNQTKTALHSSDSKLDVRVVCLLLKLKLFGSL